MRIPAHDLGNGHPEDYPRVTTYTYDQSDSRTSEDFLSYEPVAPELRVEVTYVRDRHVIRIASTGSGPVAEFDDRSVRSRGLRRDPRTRALEPIFRDGEPAYYYLAREVDDGRR